MSKEKLHRRVANRRIEIIVKGYFKDLYDREDAIGKCIKFREKNIDIIRGYEQWAVEETLQAIFNRSGDMTVLDAVENFRSKMDNYACKNYIFAIAYDIATCILDELIYCGYH